MAALNSTPRLQPYPQEAIKTTLISHPSILEVAVVLGNQRYAGIVVLRGNVRAGRFCAGDEPVQETLRLTGGQ